MYATHDVSVHTKTWNLQIKSPAKHTLMFRKPQSLRLTKNDDQVIKF